MAAARNRPHLPSEATCSPSSTANWARRSSSSRTTSVSLPGCASARRSCTRAGSSSRRRWKSCSPTRVTPTPATSWRRRRGWPRTVIARSSPSRDALRTSSPHRTDARSRRAATAGRPGLGTGRPVTMSRLPGTCRLFPVVPCGPEPIRAGPVLLCSGRRRQARRSPRRPGNAGVARPRRGRQVRPDQVGVPAVMSRMPCATVTISSSPRLRTAALLSMEAT